MVDRVNYSLVRSVPYDGRVRYNEPLPMNSLHHENISPDDLSAVVCRHVFGHQIRELAR